MNEKCVGWIRWHLCSSRTTLNNYDHFLEAPWKNQQLSSLLTKTIAFIIFISVQCSTPVHPIIISFDLFTKCSICQHTIFEIKNYHSWTPYPFWQLNWSSLRPHGISSRRKDFRASDERYCSSPNLEGQWRVHVDLLKVMPIMIHHFDNKSNWDVHTGDPSTTGPRIVRSLGSRAKQIIPGSV